MTLRRYAPIEERLWALVDKSGECWEWTGATATAGYGQLRERGTRRLVFVHRLSWEIANGRAVPAGMYVCHTCDNRRCVRPDHLWLGTNRDNQLDAREKGRSAIGERHPLSKLTASDVVEIRRRLAAGDGPTHLAATYGVSRPAIQAIRQGRNWRAVS